MSANQSFSTRLPSYQQLTVWVEQHWEVGAVQSIELINLSENAMYRVICSGNKWFSLRLSQPGYQSDQAIQSECWLLERLNKKARNFKFCQVKMARSSQSLIITQDGWRCVLFHWIFGDKMTRDQLTVADFKHLSLFHQSIQAEALSWRKDCFERPVWTPGTFLYPNYAWGNWRAHPAVTPSILKDLEHQERDVMIALQDQPSDTLCHGDLRAANLLRNKDGTIAILDFDDCAFAWPEFELAAALSFDEHLPTVGGRVCAWLAALPSSRDVRLIHIAATMVLRRIAATMVLRRLSLIGWMTTHSQAPEAKELGVEFVEQSAGLLQWLKREMDS